MAINTDFDEIVTNKINGNIGSVRKGLTLLNREEIHQLLVYMANDLNYDIEGILAITKYL